MIVPHGTGQPYQISAHTNKQIRFFFSISFPFPLILFSPVFVSGLCSTVAGCPILFLCSTTSVLRASEFLQLPSLHPSSAPPVLHFSPAPVIYFSVLAFSRSPPTLWPLLICSASGVVVAVRVLTSSIPHFRHLQVVLVTPLPFFSLFIFPSPPPSRVLSLV